MYDKRNLFMTEKDIFNQPELEIVTFSTEFGKFGLMTCFDAMYDHPFLDLVLKEEITTLVFPTAWENSPPHLTAVGFHSGHIKCKTFHKLLISIVIKDLTDLTLFNSKQYLTILNQDLPEELR